VDVAPARLEIARKLGADVVCDAREAPEQLVADLTGELGVDVAVEAVGLPETFEVCARMARPGGRIAVVGVHGRPATLHLEELWDRNVTVTTGLVDTRCTPTLLKMAATGRLPTSQLITHLFPLERMEEAYEVFAHPAETGAIKVVLGGPHREVVPVQTT